MPTRTSTWLLVAASVVALASCGKKKAPPPAETTATPASASARPTASALQIDQGSLAAFGPLPKEMTSDKNPITPAKVELGRMLYYDKRLSRDNDVSCETCHQLAKYGVDHLPVSLGEKGQKGTRNAPTVYNAAGHAAQFWDGRAADVEEQAKGPVLNPVEMGMKNAKAVEKKLSAIPGYVAAFKKAFPDDKNPVTFDNFAEAVGAFERKLVTPSRWDQFLQGNDKALTEQEKRGFKTFVATGCPTCHTGVYVGGSMFQKLGLVKPWPDQKDQGRYQVTKKDQDRMMFLVASLRNVAETAPYFSDASAKTLPQAVHMMAEYQLGKNLDDAQVASIVTWLKSLTGTIPTSYIAEPKLPGAK